MQSYSVEAVLKATGADKFSAAFERAATNASRFEKVGGRMKSVGKTMTAAVTLPIVAMGAAIIKTGAQFDDQMSTVKAVTGATGKEMEQLRGLAKEMGNTTRFSASEAGEGMEMLARAGFETSDIMDSLPDVLNLAAAGAVDLGDAADITSNILSGFGMEASETARVADVLAKASADSNVDVQGLGESFKYVGPVASSLGLSIEDTAASIGLLGDAGIQGGQAGRMLRSGLQSLAAPTSQAANLMNDLGIEVFDANGEMKPMPSVISELENGLKGMSAKQKQAALETLFGSDAMSAWGILVEEGSDSLGKFSDELENSGGAAANMAEEMEDNLAGSFRSLGSALEGLSISFYEMGEGPLKSLVDWITKLVRKFTNMSDSAKQWIIIFAGIAAAIGPLLIVIGTLVSLIPKVIAGFKMLGAVIGFLTGPIGIIIAIIGALIAALIFAYQKSETFRNIVHTAFNAIKEVTMTVIGTVSDFIMEMWGFLVDWWEENNELILSAAQRVWNGIMTVITAVMEFLAPFMEMHWENIKVIVEVVWEYIKTYIEIALTYITGIIKAIMQIINGDWEGAWETIKETLTTVWNLMKDFVSTVTTKIKDRIKENFELVKQHITKKITAAKDALVAKFKEMLQNSIQKAVEIVTNVRNKFEEIKQNIKNKITESKNELVSRFTEMVTSTATKAAEIVSTARQKFEEVKNAIRDKLTEAVTVVGQKVGEMPGKAREKVMDMIVAGIDLVKGLIDGIKNMSRAAVEAIAGVVNGVVEKAKSLLKVKSPSRVFKEIGEFTGEGMAIGITDSISDVMKASDELAYAAIPDIEPIDIASQVDSINQQAERQLDHTFNSNLNIQRQPIIVNIYDNKEAVRAYVNENNAVDAQIRRF